eukprot:scaffold31956_cov56-Isochrysis_galbana.AAC.1
MCASSATACTQPPIPRGGTRDGGRGWVGSEVEEGQGFLLGDFFGGFSFGMGGASARGGHSATGAGLSVLSLSVGGHAASVTYSS